MTATTRATRRSRRCGAGPPAEDGAAIVEPSVPPAGAEHHDYPHLVACCIDGRQDGLGLWRRGSDGVGEFSEDCREPMPRIDIDAEFVVTAAQVLHKRVSRADHVGAA